MKKKNILLAGALITAMFSSTTFAHGYYHSHGYSGNRYYRSYQGHRNYNHHQNYGNSYQNYQSSQYQYNPNNYQSSQYQSQYNPNGGYQSASYNQNQNQNNSAHITQIFGSHINNIPLMPGDNAVRQCWENTRMQYTMRNDASDQAMQNMKNELTQCKQTHGLPM